MSIDQYTLVEFEGQERGLVNGRSNNEGRKERFKKDFS